MRFSTIITVRSLKSLSEFIRSRAKNVWPISKSVVPSSAIKTSSIRITSHRNYLQEGIGGIPNLEWEFRSNSANNLISRSLVSFLIFWRNSRKKGERNRWAGGGKVLIDCHVDRFYSMNPLIIDPITGGSSEFGTAKKLIIGGFLCCFHIFFIFSAM